MTTNSTTLPSPKPQQSMQPPAQRPISLQQQKVEARRARNPNAGKRKYNPDPDGLD